MYYINYIYNIQKHIECVYHVSSMGRALDYRGSWKKRARRDPCEIRRPCQIICEFFQHIKQPQTIRCLVNSQSLSTALTVISATLKVLQHLKHPYYQRGARESTVTVCVSKRLTE